MNNSKEKEEEGEKKPWTLSVPAEGVKQDNFNWQQGQSLQRLSNTINHSTGVHKFFTPWTDSLLQQRKTSSSWMMLDY